MQLSDFLNAAIAPWAALYWSFSSAAQSVQPASAGRVPSDGTLRPEHRLESLGLPEYIIKQVVQAHPLLLSDCTLEHKLSLLPEDARTLQLAAIESDLEVDYSPEGLLTELHGDPADVGSAADKTMLVLPVSAAPILLHRNWVCTVAQFLPGLAQCGKVRTVELHLKLEGMAGCERSRRAVMAALDSLAVAARVEPACNRRNQTRGNAFALRLLCGATALEGDYGRCMCAAHTWYPL